MQERTMDSMGNGYAGIDAALKGVVIGLEVPAINAEQQLIDYLAQTNRENPKGCLSGAASPLLPKNVENSGVTGGLRLMGSVWRDMGYKPGKGKDSRFTRENYPRVRPPDGSNSASLTFRSLCERYGSTVDPDDPKMERTQLESLVVRMFEAAKGGDTKAAKVILDRTDPAVRRVAVEGIAAELGNQMLRRMLEANAFPVREGFELPVVESRVLGVVRVQEGSGGQDGS